MQRPKGHGLNRIPDIIKSEEEEIIEDKNMFSQIRASEKNIKIDKIKEFKH